MLRMHATTMGQTIGRRGAALAAVTTLVASLAGAAIPAYGAAGSDRVDPNTRLGITGESATNTSLNPLRGRDIPAFAVDPADPRHIVLVDEEFLSGQCDYQVTFDGGKTWSGGHLTVPSGFASPPCHTFDSGGYAHFNKSVVFGSGNNVYTTFASHRGPQERPESKIVQGEGDSVMVARSTDGGRTFQTAVAAIHGSPKSQPFVIRPGIAVQPRPGGDKLYAVGWSVVVLSGGAGGGKGPRELVTATSNDAGATWSAPVVASGPNEQIREPTQPVVGPDGSVYVGWRNRDPAPATNHIVVARSADGGATWTRSQAGVVGGTGISGGGGFPRLAVDHRTGTLYVVYQAATLGDLDVYLQRSTDHGTTWSAPLRVNDDASGNGVSQVTPQVFVAPDGRVDVLWLDQRNSYPTPKDEQASGEGDIYYSSSSDGGKTFSANRRITDRSINLDAGLNGRVGSYTWYGPDEAPLGSDSVLFGWADPRLGNVTTDSQDIYLATMNLHASGSAPVQQLPTHDPADFSVALSQLAYPGGAEEIGGKDSSKVVIVNQSDHAAALAGTVLARASFGPLLLSPASGLTKQLKAEVARIHPSGAYLVGDASALSGRVVTDLRAAGVKGDVQRLSGSTLAETARAVAQLVSGGGAAVKESDGNPAPVAAVVVNPDSADAGAAAALAAAARFPVLFASRDAVPAATSRALRSLGIHSTLVVGNSSEISDKTLAQLPSAKRLGGANTTEVSTAVAREAVARGMPTNVVYVTDAGNPMDAAVLGAAVARTGGLMLVTAGASASSAQGVISALRLNPTVDRLVVAKSATPTSVPWAIIAVAVALAVIGLGLLGWTRARARGRRRPGRQPQVGHLA